MQKLKKKLVLFWNFLKISWNCCELQFCFIITISRYSLVFMYLYILKKRYSRVVCTMDRARELDYFFLNQKFWKNSRRSWRENIIEARRHRGAFSLQIFLISKNLVKLLWVTVPSSQFHDISVLGGRKAEESNLKNPG